MTGRQSAATDKALKLVAKGLSVAAAARKAGISWTTLYRAQERLGTRTIKRKVKPGSESVRLLQTWGASREAKHVITRTVVGSGSTPHKYKVRK